MWPLESESIKFSKSHIQSFPDHSAITLICCLNSSLIDVLLTASFSIIGFFSELMNTLHQTAPSDFLGHPETQINNQTINSLVYRHLFGSFGARANFYEQCFSNYNNNINGLTLFVVDLFTLGCFQALLSLYFLSSLSSSM